MNHPSNPEAQPDGIEVSKLVPFSLKSSLGVVHCNFWDFSGLPIYVCGLILNSTFQLIS